MYRYGDGTPFPLDDNFFESLTAAVEACTGAFMPLTELDTRRDIAKLGRTEADRELAKLTELEKSLSAALSPYMVSEKKAAQAQGVAQKTLQTAKLALQQARAQVEGRVSALEAQAAASTASDAVLHALRPFFDQHQLPNAKWIMSWDVRGAEPVANAVATSGRMMATFSLQPDPYRQPIRGDQLAESVIVHMMKKGLLGKAKPAPVELGMYVMVAYEKKSGEHVITLKEKQDRASLGLRYTVGDKGATWQSLSPTGAPEGEYNPLDVEDEGGIRRLGEGASNALKDLVSHRTLARTIGERARMSGELVLKRDIGGGRREELFVPRAQLAAKFAKLPMEYRKPFEDMGIAGEDTQPAIQLPESMRPPARPAKPSSPPPPPGAHAPPPPPPGAHPPPSPRQGTEDQKTLVGAPLPEDLEMVFL